MSIAPAAPKMPPDTINALRGAQLLFFGGKGGVGKTTASAAAALRLAASEPSRRVLLLSTDPAHSLADVFGIPVGHRETSIPGGPANLRVRELDAAAAFAARRKDLETALADVLEAVGGDELSAGQADEAVGKLIDLAPPGIDELFGMLTVVEARREYPLIIVDTAPTGHALRLLETPHAARDWVQVLMRVLLKYQSLVRPGRMASELIDLSKTIRALLELMRDPAATRFIVVTRATEVTRLETERLLARLRGLRLAAPIIVLNAMTLAPGSCPWCQAAAAAGRRHLARLRPAARRRGCVIIQTPLAAPPPRGVAALDRWARSWTSDA